MRLKERVVRQPFTLSPEFGISVCAIRRRGVSFSANAKLPLLFAHAGPNFAASLKEVGNSGGDTIKIAGGTILYSRSSASQSTTDFPVAPGGETVVACGSLLAFIAVSSSLNRQVGEGKRPSEFEIRAQSQAERYVSQKNPHATRWRSSRDCSTRSNQGSRLPRVCVHLIWPTRGGCRPRLRKATDKGQRSLRLSSGIGQQCRRSRRIAENIR